MPTDKEKYGIFLMGFVYLILNGSFSTDPRFTEVQFSSVLSEPLQPHGLQHARLPCPSFLWLIVFHCVYLSVWVCVFLCIHRYGLNSFDYKTFSWLGQLERWMELQFTQMYKFGKLSSGHRTGKGQFLFQSQRKAMSKNAQTTAQLHSSHRLVK